MTEGLWSHLDRWAATAFIVGGLFMIIDAIIVGSVVVSEGDDMVLIGQGFVGVAWTAACLGLLGLYPTVSQGSRRLARVGAGLALIGVATFALMAVSVAVYVLGIPSGEYEAISTLFIPGVFLGSILGFATFSLATYRSGVYRPSFAVLLLLPALLVLTNILRFIAGFESEVVTLMIVIGDALAMLTIGIVLSNRNG